MADKLFTYEKTKNQYRAKALVGGTWLAFGLHDTVDKPIQVAEEYADLGYETAVERVTYSELKIN